MNGYGHRFNEGMRWLRRIAIVVFIALGAVAAVVVVFALLLPSDATKHVLEVRGRFGGVEEITARMDAQSSVRHIALRNHRGEVVTNAWVRRPRVLRSDYRIIITYAGQNTGEAILSLIKAKDDLVLMAVQYPWTPPHTAIGKLRTPYDIRQAAYRTVAGGMLAVDELAEHEHLDTNRIVLMGASLGSIFATIHGAMDQRVPLVVLVHGGTDLSAPLDAELRERVPAWLCPAVVRLARIPIDTFNPSHYVARIAPRKLLVIAARDDQWFPPEAVMAFFDRARQPKELRWTNSRHVGARNRRVVDVIIAELASYLDSPALRSQSR